MQLLFSMNMIIKSQGEREREREREREKIYNNWWTFWWLNPRAIPLVYRATNEADSATGWNKNTALAADAHEQHLNKIQHFYFISTEITKVSPQAPLWRLYVLFLRLISRWADRGLMAHLRPLMVTINLSLFASSSSSIDGAIWVPNLVLVSLDIVQRQFTFGTHTHVWTNEEIPNNQINRTRLI